jgi:methylmalonyl-CoA mutase
MDLDPTIGNHFDLERKVNKYKNPVYTFKVRDREIKWRHRSLSHSQTRNCVTKYSLGRYFTLVFAGKCSRNFRLLPVYIRSSEGEDPSNVCWRSGPERTNKLCECRIASKTFVNSFDSVTLYGNDPHVRPDIWEKSE